MPRPELITSPEITLALIQIEQTPALGAEVANLLRSELHTLESHADTLELLNIALKKELASAEQKLSEIELKDAIKFSMLGR